MDFVLGWRLLYRTADELIAIVSKSSFGKNGGPCTASQPVLAHIICLSMLCIHKAMMLIISSHGRRCPVHCTCVALIMLLSAWT